MGSLRTSTEMLAAVPPALPAAVIARAVEKQFGLRGRYAPLVSERDQNLELRCRDGRSYVVKIANPEDAAYIGGFQVELLDYLQGVSAVAVPEVVRTTAGRRLARIDCNGVSYPLRVVSYVPGVPLAQVDIGPAVATEFGARLAQLDLDLAGFEAAGPAPESPWDMQRATELRCLLAHVDDAEVRRLVGRTIENFAVTLLPALKSLPRQAIHGDANPENVLVVAQGGPVSGFIDFGDSVLAPRILDVAIAAAYLRAPATDPLRLLRPFIGGYIAVVPLTRDERALLPGLVKTRLATTIAIMYWRLAARAASDPYREKTVQSEQSAIGFLRLLDRLDGPQPDNIWWKPTK